MIDISPACRRTAGIVAAVPDDLLDAPTPCADMRLRDLLAHVGMLAQAFTAAAQKNLGEWTDSPPGPTPLDPDWRSAYPQHLAELAAAWQDADAWTGMTRAGGVDLPGEVAGGVALAEVVIHGWDVAVASGQPYDVDPATAQACLEHLQQFDAAGTEGLFGPAVPVPDDAPVLDRIIGRSGRDPSWRG
ncbi:TIGR03086 family metal-binding protein [Mycobacterium sp. MYCO198283]|uniref:TIGR03086 family metal-binding protein n=1 Tax=Mycobacterium sp. MYCO198283 TaxID=2883505 RepID=UPI001E65037A|nr:TIGR03086 family metal-binding protein [Mycobacterium sp. MYCO198283]MCG5433030.1 TIGR03086 family metal-binding protein [Mycobacterium sp. MYCO198283]